MVATTGVADDIRHHLTVTGAPSPAELARTVLTIIDGDVDVKTWDQTVWGFVGECGTVACVAGHVAALVDADPGIDCGLTSVGIQGAALRQRVTSAQLAQVALGINDDTAHALFDCDASREYVTAALETIAAG